MVSVAPSIFNIKSTGSGPLPSLDEMELKRSIQYLFLGTYGTF